VAVLRLHWSPDSANLVVRIALEELRLGFEPIRVDRAAVIKAFAGEHIGGRALTMPAPPDLPPDHVTG
jgi:hypothetical protein